MSRALLVMGTIACVGCGASPALEREPVTSPPAVVVPPERVVEKCACDGDADGDERMRKRVEYVHVTAWQSPPAAQRAEELIASSPPRGGGGGFIEMPKLTLHQGIPEGHVWRLGRTRY